VREVDGEVIVLDMVREKIHQLNATASMIWRHYQTGAERQDIVHRLAAEFDVGRDVLDRDVQDMFERFRELGLVVPAREDDLCSAPQPLK
jgi:hypothetical protein